MLLAAEGKRNHLKIYPEHSVLYNAYAKEKLVKQTLTCWGIISVTIMQGKGNTQFQPKLAILFHLGGKKSPRDTFEFTVQRHRLTK